MLQNYSLSVARKCLKYFKHCFLIGFGIVTFDQTVYSLPIIIHSLKSPMQKMLFLPHNSISCSLTFRLIRKHVARSVPCCCKRSEKKYKLLDSKLQTKMLEIKARTAASSSTTSTFRSINSMILKFPKFRREFARVKTIFDQYDKDSDGAICYEEVERCLKALGFNLKKDQVEELFHSCDVDKNQHIQFNEFIVLLCLAYILTPKINNDAIEVEAIFGTVVEAFLFLDKNGDGKLHKKDLLKALNDVFPWERSPKHVSRNRMREMDLRRRGEVGFRKFLFVFIDWVGVDGSDEQH